jgi:hypothetical protein
MRGFLNVAAVEFARVFAAAQWAQQPRFDLCDASPVAKLPF